MAIKFVPVRCPACGATVNIEEGRKQIFCSYCGTKFMIENDHEYTYHTVDEAKIKQAETERMIRLKELELEETQAKQNAKLRKVLLMIWIPISLAIIIISICIMLSGADDGMAAIYGFDFLGWVGGPIIIGGAVLIFKVIPDREAKKALLRKGGIKLPGAIFPYDEQNYEFVQTVLQNAGFTNITCINAHDLTPKTLKEVNKVKDISINGEDIESADNVCMSNASIIITYHGN